MFINPIFAGPLAQGRVRSPRFWLLGLTPQPPRGPRPPKLQCSMVGIPFGSAPGTVFLLPFFLSKIRAFFEAASFFVFTYLAP